GYIVILNKDDSIGEAEVTLKAIQAGADDIPVTADGYEIFTSPDSFTSVCDHLRTTGYELDESEATIIPQTMTKINEEEEEKMLNLIETLEDNEDVQDIYHNLETRE